MFSSREFRTIARDKLRGKWGRSVLVTFLAMLMGAEYYGGSVSTPSLDASTLESVNAQGIDAVFSETVLYFKEILAAVAEKFNLVFGADITASMIGGLILAAVIFCFVISLIGTVVRLGHCKYYIDLVLYNRKDSVDVLFSRFRIFFKAIGLSLFTGLFVFLWSLLFFIPGIIASYRYSMAPYIMAENPEVGIREAVNMSKQMMAGHKGRLFGLHLSFIGWAILSAFTLGIGSLWLNPYMKAAETAFYIDRTGRGIPTTGTNPAQ